ncbi:MAG: hypothetical protein WCR98_07900, partial [Saccharofermentanales bacterium]
KAKGPQGLPTSPLAPSQQADYRTAERPPPPSVCAALDLAKEIAQTIPELTYVSWDIALTSYPRYTQKAEAFHNNATISPS